MGGHGKGEGHDSFKIDSRVGGVAESLGAPPSFLLLLHKDLHHDSAKCSYFMHLAALDAQNQ